MNWSTKQYFATLGQRFGKRVGKKQNITRERSRTQESSSLSYGYYSGIIKSQNHKKARTRGAQIITVVEPEKTLGTGREETINNLQKEQL